MLKEKESVVRKATILLDTFILMLAFFLAHFLRQNFYTFYKLDIIPSTQVISRATASISDYLVVLFFAVLVWCFMLYLNGMYQSMRLYLLIQTHICKQSVFCNFCSSKFNFYTVRKNGNFFHYALCAQARL